MRGAGLKLGLLTLLVLAPASSAFATETISYSYDALGRLTVVSHAGGVNSGLRSGYSYDPAGNRTNVTVTGAINSMPAKRVIVIPINGYTVIPVG